MMRRFNWLFWSALAMTAVPAAAHPGHGTTADSSSLAHYATEPFHVVLLAAVLVVALGMGSWAARQIAGLCRKG